MPAGPLVSRRDLLTLDRVGTAAPFVHLASLVVQVRPERLEAARALALAYGRTEVHSTSAPGKFVVVLESSEERAIAACADDLLNLPGVLTVSVVSHVIDNPESDRLDGFGSAADS